MKLFATITEKQEEEAIEKVREKLLDPHQPGGPWFWGKAKALEKWEGDVIYDYLDYFLEEIGIKVLYEFD